MTLSNLPCLLPELWPPRFPQQLLGVRTCWNHNWYRECTQIPLLSLTYFFITSHEVVFKLPWLWKYFHCFANKCKLSCFDDIHDIWGTFTLEDFLCHFCSLTSASNFGISEMESFILSVCYWKYYTIHRSLSKSMITHNKFFDSIKGHLWKTLYLTVRITSSDQSS